MKKTLLSAILTFVAVTPLFAELVAHFPMDVKNGKINEVVSGNSFYVYGNFTPENVAGAVGDALRFDGYTSAVEASLGSILPEGSHQLTFSLWAAVPCYPIIQIDTDTREQTAIASCLNDKLKTGFGFFLGFDGTYSFKTYIGGWPLELKATEKLPVYKWNNLVAVLDYDTNSARLYNNGVVVASGKCNSTFQFEGGKLWMGQSDSHRFSGPFELMSYNGLIDDVKIWNEALPESVLKGWKAENTANLDIPASRFANDILRPRFHGMPASSWTNECHGMYFSEGRYHLFFQKNANGPYMARLHWGHISSENLYDWREEPIAIAPGAPYDIKGCWSGCVFADDVITGGKPNVLYTAVDYVKATIAQASPETADLNVWKKASSNPIINGRPAGLSDDFRDPYFFRNGANAYIIVGSSKDGVGTTTLHKYIPSSGTWSNDGSLFFTGTSAAQDGRFWEMPNVTPMTDGQWLFTATPLETSTGVHTLYWTGTIVSDGTFVPSVNSVKPKNLELISKHGFGLLSPTIYQHEGKTIALGIVPDKLSAQANWDLGWAHCYSLPREWSLDKNGNLIQRPWSRLKEMRGTGGFSRTDFTLSGNLAMDNVNGREIELCATFVAGSNTFGFNIFKNASASGVIKINPISSRLTCDFSTLRRLTNDNNIYDGVYECTLPEAIKNGDEVKINIFVDHSILDIFINDKWATSIRVFPTSEDANGVDVFSEGDVKVKSVEGWKLSVGSSAGITDIMSEVSNSRVVDVYSIDGQILKTGVPPSEANLDLEPGLYIIGGKKTIIRN